MRKYIDIANKLLEGDVVAFRPADFEARYALVPGAKWHEFQHTDHDNALRGMKRALSADPKADQGLGGIQYVDFVPLNRRAKLWLDVKGYHEQPRIYGKLAVIDLMDTLKTAGFVVSKKLVTESAKNS